MWCHLSVLLIWAEHQPRRWLWYHQKPPLMQQKPGYHHSEVWEVKFQKSDKQLPIMAQILGDNPDSWDPPPPLFFLIMLFYETPTRAVNIRASPTSSSVSCTPRDGFFDLHAYNKGNAPLMLHTADYLSAVCEEYSLFTLHRHGTFME